MTSASVQPHNGATTLFIDDRPVFGAVHWIPDPPLEGEWFAEQFVRRLARAGVHLIH